MVPAGALTAHPGGAEGRRWPPGHRPSTSAPKRTPLCEVTAACQRNVGKGRTAGLWKETHGPGPADVRLIWFFFTF